MRPLYLRFWALLLVGALVLAPGAMFAQELSPGARSAIVNGAAAGAGLVSLSSADATFVGLPDTDESPAEEPIVQEQDTDEPEVDEPEVDEPEVDTPVEPEVEDEAEDDVVEVDPGVAELSGDVEAYENAGLTIMAPAEWDVTAMTMFDNLFTMEIPGSDFVGLIQGGEALDFPGVLAVIIMRSLPEFIVAQFGEGAVLVETVSFVTTQDLPVVKIEFEADLEGEATAGAFYVISPGATAYIMIAVAPIDQWGGVRDAADAVAASIEFEPDLITLVGPADEPLFVVDADELLEIVLPELWLAAATDDPDLPILAVAPGYEFVAAFTGSQEEAEDVATLLDETFIDGEEVNEDIVDLVMDLMGEAMNFDQDMMRLDPTASEVFVVRDELILRMVGSIDIDVDVQMPIAIYVGLRRDGISALIVFGDLDAAFAVEDTLVSLLDSLLFIR